MATATIPATSLLDEIQRAFATTGCSGGSARRSTGPLPRDVRTVERRGAYVRVADPGWRDPLDGRHARARGGRWNPPESFPVVYLCATLGVARANVIRKLE